MKRRFYIVGRERRQSEPSDAPEGRERRVGSGHYIGLRDRRVSRRHAEIYVVDDRIFVRDLASKNGTFVIEDGRKRPLREGYVRPDHVVSFGGYRQTVASLIDNGDGGDHHQPGSTS